MAVGGAGDVCLSAGLESKGKLRGKAKAQKKKEERERKSSVKTPGDELKDGLADNDDSSSTTTETSNPDVEANIKEVPGVRVGGGGQGLGLASNCRM